MKIIQLFCIVVCAFMAALLPCAIAQVPAAPFITSSPILPAGTIGVAYDADPFTATGLPAAMTWSVASGALPDGLTLNANSGLLSGIPTAVGTFTFTVQAANGVLPHATQSVSLEIGIPGVTISATTLNFPSQVVTTTSGTQVLTVTNTSSTAYLTVSVPSIVGPFMIDATACATVFPDGRCGIRVKFSPVVPGAAVESLVITTNAADSPHTILLTGNGSAVVPGGGPFAYISNNGSDTVTVIDTANNTVTATVPVGNFPYGVAVNPAGTRVYVANGGSSTVSVIDATDNTVIATTEPIARGQGLAVNPTGARLYVVNNNGFDTTGSLQMVNTLNNFPLPGVTVGNFPRGVAVNPAGTRAYVTNTTSNSVSVMDTLNNAVTATVPVGTFPAGVAVNPAGTRVYVANEFGDSVSVIDAVGNTVIATVPVGSSPFGVAVHPAGTWVYVANSGSGSVSVIDAANRTVVGTVMVGDTPIGVAVNPAGTRVYVTNSGSDTVSVIDTASNTVVATMAVGTRPSGFGSFIGPNIVSPIALTAVFSRKSHNGVLLDLPVVDSQPITVEPRANGSGHTVVFRFDTLIAAEGTAAALDSALNPGATVSLSRTGFDVIATLTNVADNKRLNLTLSGVNGSTTVFSATLGFLAGDINSSHAVNAADISAVKARIGQAVNALNGIGVAKYDLNADGSITQADVSLAKARSGKVLPP